MERRNPLTLRITSDHTTIATGREAVVHLLAELAVPADESSPRPPLTVCLVLDVSSSMRGEPLSQVVGSAKSIVELLRPTDRIAVVSFGSKARLSLPLRSVSPNARRGISEILDSLSADGSTNMEAGLRLGAKALQNIGRSERSVMLVLSDGMPNVGRSDPDELATLARRIRRSGVSISTLGFGSEHDDRVLMAVSDSASGRYRFIQDPVLCRHHFVEAVSEQSDVAVEAVRLELQPAPGVETIAFLGRRSATREIEIPDLRHGDRHLVVARLRVSERSVLGGEKIADVEVSYRIPGQSEERQARGGLSLERSTLTAPMLVPALHQILVIRAEEERCEARSLADSGDYEAAARRIRDLIGMIEQAPGFENNDGSPLAEAREQLIDDADLYESDPNDDIYDAFRRGQQLSAGGQVRTAAAYQPVGADARLWLQASRGVEAAGALVDLARSIRHPILSSRQILGRSRTCDICIPSAMVSRQAAAIIVLDGTVWLEDLGSTNGVQMEGRRVQRAQLKNGDVFYIGSECLRYEAPGGV